MATEQSLYSHKKSARASVLFHTLTKILRTSRVKPASDASAEKKFPERTVIGRKCFLVENSQS